jgi:hypothetical protein
MERILGVSLLLLCATTSCQPLPPRFVESKSPWTAQGLAELGALLRRGEHAELERRLDAAQAAYERDPLREFEPEAAFFTFYTSDPSHEAPLRAWAQARPESAAAHLALGLHLSRQGWLQRGYRLARRTPPEQFERMEARFEAARWTTPPCGSTP